jgi:clathrin heavy chain
VDDDIETTDLCLRSSSFVRVFPINKLVDEVKRRNRLKIMLPWVEAKVASRILDALDNLLVTINIQQPSNNLWSTRRVYTLNVDLDELDKFIPIQI